MALAPVSFAAMEFKEADLTTVKNIVERTDASGLVAAKVNDKITENSKVSTAAASMAELTFADASITRMGANTQFSFQSKERLVKLEQGTVLIHTPPGNGGATVDCGGVTAAVSGTTFMASRDTSGNAMFVLLEGQGGLKVTVGGSSTIIRPGQAASVGTDAIQEAKSSSSSSDSGGGAQRPGSSAAADDKKAGGGGSSSGASGGGEGGGTPPPAAAPKIQVFEVDVKKVVSTTPLIVEFKNELPSAAKIEKTVEIQQAKVQEGKLEKLEVEVVAVKSKDGDPLVGAPKLEKEEMVVVNKKTETVAKSTAGGNLDIDTAAGPEAGGPAPDARPAPAPLAVAQNSPAPSTPTPPTAVSVVSQIANTAPPQPSPTSLDFTVSSGGVARATLDRATPQAAPVGLAVSSIPGLTLSPNSTTIPAGSATSGNFALSLVNPRAFFPGWDSSFGLNPLVLRATAGSFSDLETTSALWPRTAIENENPVRKATDISGAPAKVVAALDAYFYFDQRAPGITTGPASFFSAVSTALRNAFDASFAPTDLGIVWTASERTRGDEFLFYAAQSLQAHDLPSLGLDLRMQGSLTENISKVFFGSVVRAGGTSGNFGSSPWANTTGIYDPSNFGPPGTPNSLIGSWDEWTGSGLAAGNPAVVGDRWRTWNDEGGSPNNSDYLYFRINPLSGSRPTPSAIFLAGTDQVAASADLQVIGFSLTAAQARLEFFSAGSARIESSWFTDLAANAGLSSGWSWSDADVEDHTSFKVEAKERVILGASSSAAGTVTSTTASRSTPVTDADAEDKQVRIDTDTAAGGSAATPQSLAVVRSGDSLELRNVVIRGFAGAKLEGAAGRVLVSGTTMRDFKIKELAGLAVNTDAKIQMAAVDVGGNLAGTMQVAEGLPVDKQATGQMVNVAVDALNRRMEEVKLDANEVNLAANKIHIGADNLRTQISAQNLITLRANTVLMQNTFMTVMNNSGIINVYVRGVGGSLVNPTFGTMVADKLNFQGANTFKIGSLTFDVRDQATLDQALANRHINEITSPGVAPEVGRLNVIQM